MKNEANIKMISERINEKGVDKKILKKKKEWFERRFAHARNSDYYVRVAVGSAKIIASGYDFRGSDISVYLDKDGIIVAVIGNIMDIEGIY